jgi:hypothetical protein
LKVFADNRELSPEENGSGEILVHLPADGQKTELSFVVEDNSGRSTRLSQNVVLLSGTGIDWAYAVPNPIRQGGRLQIEYFLGGDAESLQLSIYDSASALIYKADLAGLAGKNRYDWDLRSLRGNSIANGVYFFRLRAIQQGRSFVKTGKFAVLR